MFRNQYDSDNTTWSPQGRLFQIEYATEAVKQGSATVGLKSKTHVVLCTYNRQIDELGAYQKKIFEIDSHVGCAISGFSPDGRVLTSDMRTRCIDYTYVYGVPHPIGKLVSKLSSDAQENTQVYGKRPFGVGLVIAGYDGKPRLIETTPSGVCSSYKAQAIGEKISTVTVIVNGSKDVIDTLDTSSIEAYVDLDGLGVGEHSVEVKVKGDDTRLTYTPRVKEIKIKISKK